MELNKSTTLCTKSNKWSKVEAQGVEVSPNLKSILTNFVVDNKIKFHYEPWSKLIVYKKNK
jgi:hypothetical protein